MLDVGGQDATEAFEDVGHSDEAREILNGLKVGKLRRVVCLCPNLQTHSIDSILIVSFCATGRRPSTQNLLILDYNF